ncbi:hypothetical protein M3J09_009797 [Ascochyta lentis]
MHASHSRHRSSTSCRNGLRACGTLAPSSCWRTFGINGRLTLLTVLSSVFAIFGDMASTCDAGTIRPSHLSQPCSWSKSPTSPNLALVSYKTSPGNAALRAIIPMATSDDVICCHYRHVRASIAEVIHTVNGST